MSWTINTAMLSENLSMSRNHAGLRPTLGLLAAFSVLFVLIWQSPPQDIFHGAASYDPLHTALETLSIVIAGLVFGVVWNADNRDRPGNLVVLACALLAAACIDFLHLLSYAGMPALVTAASPEKAINFWLAARLIVAVALLVAALRPWRPMQRHRLRYLWLACSLVLVVLIGWLGLYHQDIFPRTFIPGQGLTRIKIGIEYLIVALLLPSAVIFLRRARHGAPYDAASLFAAAALSILSELCFTLYSGVTDVFNLLGHVYKVIAYLYIFRAVFVDSVREPFERLRHTRAELEQAVSALRDSEERFRGLVETSSDWIWEVDESGRYTYASPQVHALLGYEPREMLGHTPFDFMPPQEAERVGGVFLQYVTDRKPFSLIENTNIHKGGALVILETSGMPFFGTDGTYSGYRGIDRDVTQKKMAERALRESEEQLRTITNAAQDGIVMMDCDGTIAFWNQSAERIFGYSSGEAIGMSLHSMLVPSRYQDAYRDGLARFTETGTGSVIGKTLELEAAHKAGGEFPVELSVSAVEHEGRRSVIGVIRDITERKRSETTLRKLNRTLTTLSRGNEALVRAPDEAALLQAVCNVLVHDGVYLMAWVGYADAAEGSDIRVMARAGEDSAFLDHMHFPWTEQADGVCPSGSAIRSGAVQVTQDIGGRPDHTPWCAEVRAHRVKGAAAFPLAVQDQAFGALVVYAATAEAFDTQEVALLQELASDLAYGIQMLRARTERDRMREKLKTALTETIEAVARMVEKRDPYTAGHQQRVSELAVAIAGELGLDEQCIEGIRLGGMILDIGKISIPAEILSRPGRLARVEYEIVKSHAQIGYDIIKDVHFPWPVAVMVWQHHERMDGSGYPQGLKGDEIIQEARILAVADVVEAMVSHRPYRPGLEHEVALAEIEQGRGRLYCPQAADACLRLFREKQFQWTPIDY